MIDKELEEMEDVQREDQKRSFGTYKGLQVEALRNANATLNERLDSKNSPNQFLNLVIDHLTQKMSESDWKSFIDSHTPDAWRIAEICKDPGNVAQILALFNERKVKDGKIRKSKAFDSASGEGH